MEKRKTNRLTQKETHDLWEALKANAAQYQQTGPSYKAVAADLTIKLGFEITGDNVHNAVKIGVVKWEPKMSPNGKAASGLQRRVAALENTVRKLCSELNVPFQVVADDAPG